ncbi:MAG: methylenetetrahydrofolate--tRNA-(uracil(54)-C(5))-methyltransferase (FADH(2)-oxidizing) TrmFO [Deltaproteobacteria bacterium]|nr:methylenetetrahydrofolate--tRNA-(uracil(54)-C(5))-methyltransferase (FADH(2)-oxidizing) TrmFO [Deltaproteobacteria bacterium]
MGLADRSVFVVGAGLAGCEAARKLARFGLRPVLLEMKPQTYSPAHVLPGPAELVCSNSLKSDDPATAHGLLKQELRQLGSILLEAADRARVPAGSALAVDRRELCDAVAELLERDGVELRAGQRVESPPDGDVILATGPLTDPALAGWIARAIGTKSAMFFYDALAPIVEASSIDRSLAFFGSRWGKGGEDDYLNCPMDRPTYRRFVEALRAAPTTPLHDFEDPDYYEGCLPVEVMAERGEDALAFGPMRPVGLSAAGERHWAVVQLRAENKDRTAYNLVGFQTKLTQPAQRTVFRMIPALRKARFLRYGAVHRNFYVESPHVLDDHFALKGESRVRLAGQITGVEGYVESAAMGLWVGALLACERLGLEMAPPPRDFALGALWAHVRGQCGAAVFEPMNIHFGLLPPADGKGRIQRRARAIDRARSAFAAWHRGLPDAMRA